MKLFRLIIFAQATYILITAVWPIVHIESFMEITGYKKSPQRMIERKNS